MLDRLVEIDQAWLLAINGWHAEWADSLMWTISRAGTWIPLYVMLIAMLILRSYRLGGAPRVVWLRVLLAVAAIGLAAGLSDYLSSGIIKHLVGRPRPTHEPAIENLLHIVRGYRGGMYGFVSSHAANTMAVATTFSLIWRHQTRQLPCSAKGDWSPQMVAVLLYLWCALNAYSRMYLGVHYPGDILGGLLVGGLVAVAVYKIWVHWLCVRAAGAGRASGDS